MLSGAGRRVARVRAEAWSLVEQALETLYAATVASFFLPATSKEVRLHTSLALGLGFRVHTGLRA